MPGKSRRRMKSGAPSVDRCRHVNGIYQVQVAVPKPLQQIVAKLTGHQNRPDKDGNLPAVPFQPWFILTTGTGNPREAERIRDEKIMPYIRGILKQAQEWADPAKITAAMTSDGPPDISFAQTGALSQAQAGAILDEIEADWGHKQAHAENVAALITEIRAKLAAPADREWDGLRSRVLGAFAAPTDGPPVTTQDVIDMWVAERNQANDPPKDDAVRAYRRKMEVMFAHLGKPDDFRPITKQDLQDYRRDLITGKVAVTDKRGRKPNTRDHLETIKSLFGVAARNGLGIPINPATEIQLPPKSDKTRLPFTQAERDKILTAARSADPSIRWAHWLAAFTAAIQSELRYLTPAHVYAKEGYQVVDIKPPEGVRLKTAYRPRLLPLPLALIDEGFLDYVDQRQQEGGDDAPLFPLTEAQFDRGVNGLVRDCGITDPLKSFYSHRHFVATELEGYKITDEKGRQIDVSRYVAGHAHLDVHERHYVHRSLDQLSQAIETLPAPPFAVTL